jgi:predicted nuclease of restriction endonuclease-like RecB superfamily
MTEVHEIRLLDASDAPWIGSVLDTVERSIGEPWRVLLERLDHAEIDTTPSRLSAILRALRRVLGGSTERGRVARELRALVLGHPALDATERSARLAAATDRHGIAPSDVEAMLWADLANERPVMLPRGRPEERVLAGFANLDRIQRAVRRAYALRIRVWDDANDLVRAAARYGLVASVTRDRDESTTLDINGPLSLFHATTVYGRALTALIPLLADYSRFTLDISTDPAGYEYTQRVAPPLLLPPVPLPMRRTMSLAERLARDLNTLGCIVEREPPPLVNGATLLFPELAIEHAGRRWNIEIVGFSTHDYLAHKLVHYRNAGAPCVVLCVDEERTVIPDPPLPCGRILPFTRRVPSAALLSLVEGDDDNRDARTATADPAA